MCRQWEKPVIFGARNPSSSAPLAVRKQHLILSALAQLSDDEIKMMKHEDLCSALRLAQSAVPASVAANIDSLDMSELRRALELARGEVRKQVGQKSLAKIWSAEFN